VELLPVIISAVVGIVVGTGGVVLYNKKNENGGRSRADDIVRKAKREAQDIVSNAQYPPHGCSMSLS